MKRLSSTFCLLLAIACASAPVKPVPPAPDVPRVGVGILLKDLPLAGVHVDVGPIGCDTDGAGIAYCQPVPITVTTAHVTSPAGYLPVDDQPLQLIAGQNTDIEVQLVPIVPPVQKRTGLVRRDGRAVTDDGGSFHPLGGTFFWAVWGWRHDRDRMLKNADALVGHDYARILGEVRWDPDPATGWPGLTIDPCQDDYEQALGETIDALYERAGLRTELTVMGGGTSCDPMTIARKVANVVNGPGRVQKIMALEASNEAYDNGPDLATMIQMVRYLRATTTVQLIALSSPFDSPGDDAMRAAASEAGATLFTIHTERDGGNFKWRQVRQGYAAASYGLVVDSNEPPGPHSSIDTNDSPLQLATMRALGIICGGAMHVFHVGDMVMGRVDPAHNRQANLWEVPNYAAMFKAVRGVDALLPAGVENWTRTSQHGGSERVGPQPLLADGIWSDGDDHGVDRAYGAVSGAAFVEVLTGVKRYVNLRPLQPMHAEAFDPETLELKAAIDLAAGDVWTLPGRADTMTAYIVRGTFR